MEDPFRCSKQPTKRTYCVLILLTLLFSDKEIEELKLSQQRALDLSKKEAEMAAEMKFGDGLTEARKAYVALKHLLDSQV